MNSSATKIALVAALVVAVIPALAFAGGPGQTVEIESVVKIRNSAPAFHGRVIADNEACSAQRLVKTFKLRRSGGKKLLGSGTADDAGKWAVPFDKLGSGAYFAVAPRVEQGTAGTIYVCLRAKSRTLVVD
jgi:hypothetical protein